MKRTLPLLLFLSIASLTYGSSLSSHVKADLSLNPGVLTLWASNSWDGQIESNDRVVPDNGGRDDKGVKIAWDITFDQGLWNYEYRITAADGGNLGGERYDNGSGNGAQIGLEFFGLQVSPDLQIGDLQNFTVEDKDGGNVTLANNSPQIVDTTGLQVWNKFTNSHHAANLTHALWLEFEGAPRSATVSFQSNYAPVHNLGKYYLENNGERKNGKHFDAAKWENLNRLLPTPGTPPTPSSSPVVPEPASILVWTLGIAFIGLRFRRNRNGKAKS